MSARHGSIAGVREGAQLKAGQGGRELARQNTANRAGTASGQGVDLAALQKQFQPKAKAPRGFEGTVYDVVEKKFYDPLFRGLSLYWNMLMGGGKTQQLAPALG